MSANDIEVGDLVYVNVWPCCDAAIGHVFKVHKLQPSATLSCCGYCNSVVCGLPTYAASEDWKKCVPVKWLRKIPPLSELEDTENKEVLHA